MKELIENLILVDTSKRLPPLRSSSLKISGDVFDSTGKNSISNMDDLELVSVDKSF